jgi:hypothetical protein
MSFICYFSFPESSTFYRGMAYPQAMDEGEGIQTWGVVADVLNKQLWTVRKG